MKTVTKCHHFEFQKRKKTNEFMFQKSFCYTIKCHWEPNTIYSTRGVNKGRKFNKLESGSMGRHLKTSIQQFHPLS